jgi:hypothetical protein
MVVKNVECPLNVKCIFSNIAEKKLFAISDALRGSSWWLGSRTSWESAQPEREEEKWIWNSSLWKPKTSQHFWSWLADRSCSFSSAGGILSVSTRVLIFKSTPSSARLRNYDNEMPPAAVKRPMVLRPTMGFCILQCYRSIDAAMNRHHCQTEQLWSHRHQPLTGWVECLPLFDTASSLSGYCGRSWQLLVTTTIIERWNNADLGMQIMLWNDHCFMNQHNSALRLWQRIASLSNSSLREEEIVRLHRDRQARFTNQCSLYHKITAECGWHTSTLTNT